MLKKTCLFTDQSKHEIARYHASKLKEAFERNGIATKTIDACGHELDPYDFIEFMSDPPDFTCSFNVLEKVSAKKFLWDVLKVPHLAFLRDPILYSMELARSPYSIFASPDRSDTRSIIAQGANALFLPPAVDGEIKMEEGERPYDVVFFANCYDYLAYRQHWQKKLPDPLGRVLDYAIDMFTTSDDNTLAEALSNAWDCLGRDESFGKEYFLLMYYYLDKFTRGKDRVELLKALKDVEVHVFGGSSQDKIKGLKGWEDYVGGQPNIVLHAPVSYEESLQILKMSKICLNSSPYLRQGVHDRVFAGLACGALPVTSQSAYLRESFEDGKDLLYYYTRRWNMAAEKVSKYLADEDERKKIVASGRRKVMKAHTWDHRVDYLIKNLPKQLGLIKVMTKRTPH